MRLMYLRFLLGCFFMLSPEEDRFGGRLFFSLPTPTATILEEDNTLDFEKNPCYPE